MGVPYTNTTLVPQVVYDYTMRAYTVLPGETVQITTKSVTPFVATIGTAVTNFVTVHDEIDAPVTGDAVAVSGYAEAAVQISGTFTGQLDFEGSVDGTLFTPIYALDPTGTAAVKATAEGMYRINCRGLAAIKVPASALSAGKVSVIVGLTAN
jgi:hypothetical protein